MKPIQEFRAGNLLKIGNDLFLILTFTYNKGARGASMVKVKLKNMTTKSVAEYTYKAAEKFDEARLEKKAMQFLFKSTDTYTFMDQTDYEQIEISAENLGDNVNFLKEEMIIDVFFYESNPVSIELPNSVELKITYTENGIRGDTTGKAMKPATVETGYELSVPLFCNNDDLIRIDTRTGEYIERVR